MAPSRAHIYCMPRPNIPLMKPHLTSLDTDCELIYEKSRNMLKDLARLTKVKESSWFPWSGNHFLPSTKFCVSFWVYLQNKQVWKHNLFDRRHLLEIQSLTSHFFFRLLSKADKAPSYQNETTFSVSQKIGLCNFMKSTHFNENNAVPFLPQRACRINICNLGSKLVMQSPLRKQTGGVDTAGRVICGQGLENGGVISHPDWECEAVRKTREETSCHPFHSPVRGPPAGAAGQGLTSGLIVNQLGLGSCPVEGRWSCHVDSEVCSDHGLSSFHPPPSPPQLWGSVRDMSALLSPWWLSWTLHGSLSSNLTPSTTLKQLLKTSVFLCQRLKCLSVL